MRLLNVNINHNFADEPSEGSDEEMSESEEVSEESADEEEASGAHPYPTPPPDDDANMSLGNGVQKITLENPKLKGPKKQPIISHAKRAIEALSNRKGSSVPAIVKYIKSTGVEVPDVRRFSRLVLKALKLAVIKGELTRVKNSFKLSEESKKKSKALEKMIENQKGKKEKMAMKESQKMEKEKEKNEKKKEMEESTNKATERKTQEPSKKSTKTKKKADNIAGNAKAMAAVKAQEALENEPLGTKSKKSETNQSAHSTSVKSKPPRKSIGTLAQPKGKIKVTTKAAKKLVAGKIGVPSVDDVDAAEYSELPTGASTPINAAQKKRKGRAAKEN